MAQRIRRLTTDQEIVSSNLTVDSFFHARSHLTVDSARFDVRPHLTVDSFFHARSHLTDTVAP